MKKNQIKVEELVYKILKLNPKTRDDDFVLIAEYYYELCPEILNMKFSEVFLGHKELGLTNFKSIERARRTIQAMYPELATKKTKEKRKMLENEHRDYYSKRREGEIYD